LNSVAPTANPIFGEDMLMLIAHALVWVVFDSTGSSLNILHFIFPEEEGDVAWCGASDACTNYDQQRSTA
jgi:hypothetical protein